MIIGNFSDISEAGCLHPRLTRALEWIKAHRNALAVGRAVLEPDVIWANVEAPFMKGKDVQRLELHRRFIDIHVPVDRDEVIGYLPSCMLRSEAEPYDPARDIAFYTDRPLAYVTLRPGDFAVMMPHDAHAPIIGPEGARIKKICVKVACWW